MSKIVFVSITGFCAFPTSSLMRRNACLCSEGGTLRAEQRAEQRSALTNIK